ncbi:LysM peptidoglycan-binding domain-containing protein [Frateuria defendens]|uniref:LysM peptidoglycan-binding domain-containing protein n=1 Tax=Frateuria defendens TaxID=2219559 RepID=UPI00066FF87C|nr:substrate-binding domain-containing protein [Frateuria defendens]
MSHRLVRLLATALIGSCLATTAIAAKTTHHKKAPAVPKGPTLVWRGDVTTARGVVGDIAKTWESTGHGKIELQPFNTASGLEAVGSGLADLAGSARGPNGSAAEASLAFTPVAWDALVMITHPSNPVGNLTLKQLHDIYYGKITNWSQLGGPDAPINVYAVASPGDGVEYSLRRLLFGRGNQPVAAPRLYVNTAKLEEAIALDPKALGVSTLAGVSGNGKVKTLRIDDTPPTVANIADGSYPLYTPLYLVTNANSPKAADTKAFIDFLSTDQAKAVLRKHLVLPYADAAGLVGLDEARRAKILAEVGVKVPPVNTGTGGTPVAAPGATYAARSAAAPTSPRTLEAKQALAERKERERADKAIVEASEKASLAGVQGSATTVDTAASRGSDFAKVSADASVSHAPSPVYTVAKGDTLASIAKKHSVSVEQLRNWNHLKGNNIKLGQVLHIGEF